MMRMARRPIGLTTKVLVALAAGLIAGAAIAASGNRSLAAVPGYLEPIGTIWVNAIRMTVVPLVVSLLIATIADEKDLAAADFQAGRAHDGRDPPP